MFSSSSRRERRATSLLVRKTSHLDTKHSCGRRRESPEDADAKSPILFHAVLQNDHKALMKTIEESLQRLHAQAKAEKERNPVRLTL